MSIATKYLGIDVKSPVIVGSCDLCDSMDNLLAFQNAGAGAVVLKSVFEEQIIYDIKQSVNIVAPVDQYGASYEYVAAHSDPNFMKQYFDFVKEVKSRLSIPVICSIDCYSFENWLIYAKRFQETGCDAIELNFAILPYETSLSDDDVERLFSNVIMTLRKSVSIPISIKVSQNFTDMAKFMQQLSWTGVAGLTLFNRPLNVDVDIDKMMMIDAPLRSTPSDLYNILRWVNVLSKKMRCELDACTGVHGSDDVVKLLLSGAQCVQVASCLYDNGPEYIGVLNRSLEQWMDKHGFDTLDQFRGMLAVKANQAASMSFRTRFIQAMAGI